MSRPARTIATTAYYSAKDPPPFEHEAPVTAERLSLAAFTFPRMDRTAGPDVVNLAAYQHRGTYQDAIDHCRAALASHLAATGETAPELSGDVVTDLERLADALRAHATHGHGHASADEMAHRLLCPLNLHCHPERHASALLAWVDAFNHHVGLRVRQES